MFNRILMFSLLILIPISIFGAGSDSKFLTVATNTLVQGTARVVLASEYIHVSQAEGTKKVLVIADGSYYPVIKGIASVDVVINGSSVDSSWAVIDWQTQAPLEHSFNVIAYKELGVGSHLIQLSAYHNSRTPSARTMVVAGSGMSIITNVAPNVAQRVMTADSARVNVKTYGPPAINIQEGDPRPTVSMMNHYVPFTGSHNVVTLVSGRAWMDCGQGDAAISIYRNNQCHSTAEATWGVNDLYTGAEFQAPMYSHAYHSNIANSKISLEATELVFNSTPNFFENPVCYRVGSNTRMISIWGMALSGKVATDNAPCSTYRWVCIGDNQGSWGGCPSMNTESIVASQTINVPQGHNGIIFFSAKSRIQGNRLNNSGESATFYFGIKIDGVKVGTVGIQKVASPYVESSRSITASYLTAPNTLSPGNHTVEVYARAQGNIKWASLTKDLPLIYFD